jgi:hypothetical protein
MDSSSQRLGKPSKFTGKLGEVKERRGFDYPNPSGHINIKCKYKKCDLIPSQPTFS